MKEKLIKCLPSVKIKFVGLTKNKSPPFIIDGNLNFLLTPNTLHQEFQHSSKSFILIYQQFA